jgi:hypothetical protein
MTTASSGIAVGFGTIEVVRIDLQDGKKESRSDHGDGARGTGDDAAAELTFAVVTPASHPAGVDQRAGMAFTGGYDLCPTYPCTSTGTGEAMNAVAERHGVVRTPEPDRAVDDHCARMAASGGHGHRARQPEDPYGFRGARDAVPSPSWPYQLDPQHQD